MKNHNQHLEELIDRFVANTATTDETDELFNLIAAEPELGKDLASAARLQAEFERDLASIDVPTDVYDSIVAAAPFASTAVGTSTSWIVLSVTSGLIAISALVFIAFNLVERHVTPGMATTTPGMATTTPGIPPFLPGISASRQSLEGSPERPFPAPEMPGMAATAATATTSATLPTEEHTLITHVQPYSATHSTTYSATHSTTYSTTYTQSYSTTYPQSHAQPYASPLESITLRVQQRPITSTSIDQQQGMVANLGLELSTPISDDLSVGLGMYNDNFPLRVINPTGDTVLASNMTWGGAHARWIPQLDLPLDISLFAQLTVGGSSRGMVTQPAIGLARSFGPLNLGVGVDCSAFAFQNNGTWNMTLQPGLRATLGIKF